MTEGDFPANATSREETDRDLVRRLLSCGDGDAQECLWRKYRSDIERAIAGELKHVRRVEVEDISQEVWITVWKKLGTWKGENGCLLPWIRTIARHKAQDYGRRIREYLCTEDENLLDPRAAMDDPAKTALARIAQARLMEALDACMGCLSDVEYLAYSAMLDGESFGDLAEELGKARNAVYQDLHRARGKVARHMLALYRDVMPEEMLEKEMQSGYGAEETPRGKRGRRR